MAYNKSTKVCLWKPANQYVHEQPFKQQGKDKNVYRKTKQNPSATRLESYIT